jgi:hypothetical protein
MVTMLIYSAIAYLLTMVQQIGALHPRREKCHSPHAALGFTLPELQVLWPVRLNIRRFGRNIPGPTVLTQQEITP